MIGAGSLKNEIDALDKKIRYENVTKKLEKTRLVADSPFTPVTPT